VIRERGLVVRERRREVVAATEQRNQLGSRRGGRARTASLAPRGGGAVGEGGGGARGEGTRYHGGGMKDCL